MSTAPQWGLPLRTYPSRRSNPILLVLRPQVHHVQRYHQITLPIMRRRHPPSLPIPRRLRPKNYGGQVTTMDQLQQVQYHRRSRQETERQRSRQMHLADSCSNGLHLIHQETDSMGVLIMGHPPWLQNAKPFNRTSQQETDLSLQACPWHQTGSLYPVRTLQPGILPPPRRRHRHLIKNKI